MFLLLMMLASDPWAPDVEAAAEAAVARLGDKRALDIQSLILQIVGLEAIGLVANVQGLQAAKDALKAEESAVEIRINFAAEVLFDFDKSDIRPEAATALSQLATIIRANPNGQTRLEAHADSVGDDRYNQTLSERRAQSVKKWLVDREQIDGSKLITKGWGETKPVAPNDTDANRQKNRRLEAIVEKK